MKGLTDVKRQLLHEMLSYVPGHARGAPYAGETLRALEELLEEGRITVYTCECGDRHPMPTSAGKDALKLDAIAKTPLSVG